MLSSLPSFSETAPFKSSTRNLTRTCILERRKKDSRSSVRFLVPLSFSPWLVCSSRSTHTPSSLPYLPGILNNTRTPTGKHLLRTWLLRPLLSIKEIAARHDAVALFVRPENHVPVTNIEGLLQGMSNIGKVLGRMRKGAAVVSDWKALLEVSRIRLVAEKQRGGMELIVSSCFARASSFIDAFRSRTELQT